MYDADAHELDDSDHVAGSRPSRFAVVVDPGDTGEEQQSGGDYCGDGGIRARLSNFRRTINTCIVACVEHPSAPRYWIIFLLAAMGIAFAFHVSHKPHDNTSTGSRSGSSIIGSAGHNEASERRDQIYDKLGALSGNILKDSTSDQFWAAHWISDRDEMALPANSPYLIQRYALAVLYYALGLDRHFADGGGGKRWLDAGQECQWAGVRCDDERYVTELRLVNMYVKDISTTPGLSGTIPPEISSLSSLQILDLRNNKLSGTVPDSIGDLSQLSTLSLDNNILEGGVSSKVCALATGSGGLLEEFTTDCYGINPEVDCSCCTNCQQRGDSNAGLNSDSDSIGDVEVEASDESGCADRGELCTEESDCCDVLRCMGDGTCF